MRAKNTIIRHSQSRWISSKSSPNRHALESLTESSKSSQSMIIPESIRKFFSLCVFLHPNRQQEGEDRLSGPVFYYPTLAWSNVFFDPRFGVRPLPQTKQVTGTYFNVPGLVTNSNIYCLLKIIKDQCKKCFFTNTQSKFTSIVETVSWDFCTFHNTPDRVSVSLKFWKQQMR